MLGNMKRMRGRIDNIVELMNVGSRTKELFQMGQGGLVLNLVGLYCR